MLLPTEIGDLNKLEILDYVKPEFNVCPSKFDN